ncbi:UvrD-helicase domain-containing protein [Ruminococcus sp. FMB-CY1]|uniref:ATP-dependent helicase n=1 Tax=unclassified Ruminococcus TaxID=2608920 RepID=UPI00208FB165|nr:MULTISPECIES: UvrD-helicase domain-containing protein [unclassified Ruminococcus]USP70092.1 UvrD-helicase domain-containing protein [Ruminococcus sp. FMBCY1]WBX56594.1 UvrD-helicase domain-containing protein [Ruminococcus sp. FMB-CY1]
MVQSELKKQFSHMNNMQQQAVFCTEGPLLILAGAGSGKTTVLVNRIAYILQSELCKPWQILAITFTNKAAGELKERICNAVPEGGSDIWAATFHSTCARILRRYGDRIGFTSHFTVYGTDDQKKLVKDILKQLNYDEKMLPVKRVLNEISKAKDEMLTPQEMLKRAGYDNLKQSVAKVYEIYQSRLKTADAMDFDDMLCKTVELFQKCPDILEFYQNQFKYIMVDEYQDTNKVQYKFVSMLAAKYGNICVVGDDDQSIYKFRGATIENILSFENTFKGAKMIRLEQNYRSTQNILNAANGVISNNTMRKGKTLWTENAVGDKIEVHTSDSERDEAQFIAKTILDGVADGRKFSDFAILYRMNAQSNAIEQALSRSGIPHRVIGGRRFYDREEIRDMVAYLQVINNPHDDVRLGRIINVPKRGIGATTLEKASEIAAGLGESIYSVIKDADVYPQLSRAATKLKSFVALIDGLMEAEQSGDYSLAELYNLILEHTDYEKYLKTEKDNPDVRIENIEELSSNIIKFEEDYAEEASLSNFLEEISLQTDIDNYDAEADSSVMMTLHSAKGLEFPVVFIAGLEEGVFPSIATMMNPDELNEERRLAYVGITRAKEKLYITKAKSRMLMGHTSYNKVSRFVNEIPPELLNYTGEKKTFASTNGFSASSSHISIGAGSKFTPNKSFNTFTKPAVKSGTVYKKGDCVFHKVFGKGMIMKTEKMGNDTMLEVAFDKAGTKTLMANFSKMEKI